MKNSKKIPQYDPVETEKKWQKFWKYNRSFEARTHSEKPKFYPLIEFPYPSGSGLHVGHPRPYTAIDVVARKRRFEGYNVLFTMGWDAFGLPTENYAIKHQIHPAIVTKRNIEHFKTQLQNLGFSFDWEREIDTTDPEYYKWTQWIFIKMFEHGLAYKQEMMINWCNSCKIGLANEEVVQGNCDRCGGAVVQKPKSQWMLAITKYAEKLLEGLEEVDFIERVKAQQRNWIGKSQGAEIIFGIYNDRGNIKSAADTDILESLKVFTTRPDTIYGATYMVISPEHPILKRYSDLILNIAEVENYIQEAKTKSDFERSELNKDKTGVMLEGICAKNPITENSIPIWISDYVLMTYGTGAIMAVPGHDSRDLEFAEKFGMPIIEVVKAADGTENYEGTDGTSINSPLIDGLKVPDAKKKMTEILTERGIGEAVTNYKLRDWVFSRQRYWGEPIPLVSCEKCGWVPVPMEQLPLTLPSVRNYEPSDDGESPLSKMQDWVDTTCPKCQGPATRETDTMPQWAGSSWYYLRYCDPHNKEELASQEALKYWLPVDWYNGGMEHTTLHLLYSRFWHRFLYDIGVVPTKEPYQKRTSHGMIMGEDGRKMSKSIGNVINPEYYTESIGADALRMFEMFIGDFERENPWNDDGVRGCRRFLDRFWSLADICEEGDEYIPELETLMHQTVKKVSHDYENLKYNTAIAQIMTATNEIRSFGRLNNKMFKDLLIMLNPVAPHITSELWEIMEYGQILDQTWPDYIEEKTVEQVYSLPVSVNGKFRTTVELKAGDDQKTAEEKAFAHPKIKSAIDGKQIKKIIYIEKKIFNILV